MSEFQKTCTTCKREIKLSNEKGKWSPYNLDGTPHRCYNNGHTKELTVEERLKRLEQIVLDPRK